MTRSTPTVQDLIALGGNEWQKGDHHRVYFNNADSLIGIEVNRYNTGNISSATLKGADISNSKAKLLADSKVFWDVNAEKWVGDADVVALIEV